MAKQHLSKRRMRDAHSTKAKQTRHQHRAKKARPKQSSVLQCALVYASQGFRVLPIHGIKNGQCTCGDSKCPSPGKHPICSHGVKDATTDPAQIETWYTLHPNANIAIETGSTSNLLAIDIDPRNGGYKSHLENIKVLGKLPKSVRVTTGGGGKHLYFRWPVGVDIRTSHGKNLGKGIDIQAEGAYIVAPPSRHISGKRYRFRTGLSLQEIDARPLPDAWIKRLIAQSGKVDGRMLSNTPDEQKFCAGTRNTGLMSLAGKLRNAGLSDQALVDALFAENTRRCEPPLEQNEVERIAWSASKYPGREMGLSDTEIVARATLAQHFGDGNYLLYAADGQFWSYDGKMWQPLVFSALKKRVWEVSKGMPQPVKQELPALIRNVISLLEAQVADSEDKLGFTQPSPVINCQNGEIRIGEDGSVEFRPHSFDSYLRHCLDIDYDPTATCPRFEGALAEIFSKAVEPKKMIAVWQELMGYVIQSKRHIPLVVICSGTGSNGKSSVADICQRLVGPSQVVSMGIEEIGKNRFALGELVGKKLLVDDDVRTGIRLPDGILKKLSEGKILTGDIKYKPYFNFACQTVPMLLCNNPPSLADMSPGMMRRLAIVRFDRAFSEKEIDRKLFPEIVANEMPGIFNWALQGMARVLKRGRFRYPDEMEAAKQGWLTTVNHIPAFIDECCAKQGSVGITALYEAYRTWCEDSGITSRYTRQHFNRCIEHLKYKKGRDAKARKFIGLSLKA